MVSPDGLVTAYPQTNALILVDSAANVERLAKLVAELDVASSRRQTAMLTAAATPPRASSPRPSSRRSRTGPRRRPPAPARASPRRARSSKAFKITPDERTNTLIVSAPPDQMQQIKALVERLDVPLPPGSGRVHVYYLKYANAEDMLPVLLDVTGAAGGSAAAGAPNRATEPAGRRQPEPQPAAERQQPAALVAEPAAAAAGQPSRAAAGQQGSSRRSTSRATCASPPIPRPTR